MEPLFNVGDYVEVNNYSKRFIGIVTIRNNYEVEAKDRTYRGGKFSYDVLVERNSQYIIEIKNAVLIADKMVLLAKTGTIANKALKLALDAHERQVDKPGVDYAYHFTAVGKFVKEVTDKDEILAVAYLHGVLEDTDVTEEQLKELFSVEVVNAVKSLTKEKYEPYQFYLERVKVNEWARIVKLADLRNNSDMDKIKKKLKTPLGQQDFKRIKKYLNAIKYLEGG